MIANIHACCIIFILKIEGVNENNRRRRRRRRRKKEEEEEEEKEKRKRRTKYINTMVEVSI